MLRDEDDVAFDVLQIFFAHLRWHRRLAFLGLHGSRLRGEDGGNGHAGSAHHHIRALRINQRLFYVQRNLSLRGAASAAHHLLHRFHLPQFGFASQRRRHLGC